MILYQSSFDLNKKLRSLQGNGLSIGFVPTMGALHEGHIALINHSKLKNNITIASIFVNPTQFNDPQDFAKYPATLEADIIKLSLAGCDLLFLPNIQEIYPNGTGNLPLYELGAIENLLEGFYRPGHFQGVCQVMERLLGIIQPNRLFLGQKDFQQCMVISKLNEQLPNRAIIEIVPTVREKSGLAMSSRNKRLSEEGLKNAAAIYQSLNFLKNKLAPGKLTDLLETAGKMLTDAGFEKIDYLVIADRASLSVLTHWDGKTPVTAICAAFLGGVRLIDNLALN